MYDASPRVVMQVFSRGDMVEDTRRNLARRIHLMDDPLEKNRSQSWAPLSAAHRLSPRRIIFDARQICSGTADSGQIFLTRYDAREIRHVRFFSVRPSAQAR